MIFRNPSPEVAIDTISRPMAEKLRRTSRAAEFLSEIYFALPRYAALTSSFSRSSLPSPCMRIVPVCMT